MSDDWIQAARAAGCQYRRASTDPRVAHLAQLGPAIVVGRTMRVAGEDAHIEIHADDGSPIAAVIYKHPAADNENRCPR